MTHDVKLSSSDLNFVFLSLFPCISASEKRFPIAMISKFFNGEVQAYLVDLIIFVILPLWIRSRMLHWSKT